MSSWSVLARIACCIVVAAGLAYKLPSFVPLKLLRELLRELPRKLLIERLQELLRELPVVRTHFNAL